MPPMPGIICGTVSSFVNASSAWDQKMFARLFSYRIVKYTTILPATGS